MTTQKLSLLSVALAAAVVAAGCSSGSDMSQPEPSTQPRVESFTDWSKNSVFAKPADGAPESMDTLLLNFDGNDNPNAYADLLPPTT